MSDRSSLPDDDRTQVLTDAPTGLPGQASFGGAAADDATVIRTPGAPPPAASEDKHDASLLAIGARVAEFEITRVVGQGGFGVVYEAHDHTLERQVAIKEYLPTSLSTRQPEGGVVPLSERHRETFDLGMRSFINEAKLLAQFDHPSLLKVYRFWQERGTTYMVMPFYQGDTLRDALAAAHASHEGVDEGWLLQVMDGVTQALGVMHAANCFHRDIAPDNILLLEGSGRPVVLDFGAARRVITDKTQAMTVILKPGYAPIEQYAEMPDMSQGPWTDVYALAAVMHVAVTGKSPPPSIARMMSDSYEPLAAQTALLQRFGVEVLAAIDAGLAVRPDGRPQSMDEFRIALGLGPSPAQEGATVAMPGSGRGGSSGPRTTTRMPTQPGAKTAPKVQEQKGNKTALIAAVVAVVVVGGAGAFWWSGRSAPVPVASTAPAAAAPAVAAAPAPTAPPQAAPRTPLQSLQALADGAAPDFAVSAKAVKPVVAIGKDKLGFEIRSAREGFAYVYMLSSGGELYLMFPNLLDKYNKVTANQTLTLPRASWPMNSGGPAGTNEFVVVVSEHERDYSAAGTQSDGVFPQFQLPVLAALETARGTGPTPLLGKPVCQGGAPCNDVYGVARFSIVEK
ncbi:protein kinase [Xylophilus rhododendri]|uniref:Protein kinase n=1 Tax=Xylophilus rhododendri TaxID=2697032 RepID=A0A857JCR5_9BURK|nr:serine/threonine-protein kinase [Xylophilus rhododendri]QHJ00992.1 protein kinase [Xylophilus rhododendri]